MGLNNTFGRYNLPPAFRVFYYRIFLMLQAFSESLNHLQHKKYCGLKIRKAGSRQGADIRWADEIKEGTINST